MNSPIIIGLINNVALLLVLGLIYDLMGYRPRGEKPSYRQVITGIVVGAIGIGVMLTPWEFSAGVIFDARSILLSISGLFFGTLPTVLAVIMTGALRVYIGGSGVLPGIGVIVSSGVIGVAWRHLRNRRLDDISLKELYALGLVVHVNMLLWMLALPWPLPLEILPKVGVPVMVIHPIGTALLGWLMLSKQKRNKTEKALQHSEHQLKLITDNLPAYVAYVGMDDLVYRFVNSKFVESYKMARHKIVGSHISEIIGQENYKFAKKYLDIVRQGQPISYENRFLTAGTERWINVNYVPDINNDGVVEGIVVLSHDITGRKKMEQALSESEKLLRTIAENYPNSYLSVIESDFSVGYTAGQEFKKQNLSAEDFVGLTLEQIFGDQTALVKEYYKKTFDGEEQSFEIFINNQYQKYSTVPFGTENGSVSRILVVAENVTEQRLADAALRESRERYHSLVNNMLDGIYRSTHDGKFVDINPAMVNMFGYSSREEMLQVDIRNELYFAPEERGSHVLDTGQKEVDVYRMRRKDGSEIWVEDHGHYVHDEQGNILYHEGILRDITERRQVELAIQTANEQLHSQLAEIKELGIALREQALRDPLTGLYNRRYMEEALQQELAKAIRKEKPLSVVMLDLDNLKEINDLYGHGVGGDKALQALADSIKPLCRTGDTFCRYAGDEFIIILYDASLDVAYKRTLDWRDVIAKIKIASEDGEFMITFSAGVAAYPSHASTGNKLIQQADKALYQAKNLGRNRVVVAKIPENSVK